MAIRILLADDHKMMRDGLRGLVGREPDMKVLGEAETGRKAVELAATLAPDVVVMDISMPDLNGVEATRQIKQANRLTRVVALSMHADRENVARMLEAGASGYLLKDCAFEELTTAVRTVVGGGTYLSPRVAGSVVDEYVRRLPKHKRAADIKLTPREREVLQLVAEGTSTKEIARKLKVSIKTVETHRARIMEKLDLHSVAELTKYAVREGLTSLER